MIVPGSANPLLLASAAEAGAYEIERSLRFNSSDSAYCSFLPSTSGNRKKWTFSIWVKRSKLGTSQAILHLYNYPIPAYYDTNFAFNSSDQLVFNNYDTSAWNGQLTTAAVFRDCSAWYHIVCSCDTDAATPIKIYVNNTQQTLTGTQPSAGSNTGFSYTATHRLGINYDVGNGLTNGFNGYFADVLFIDGQALDPTSFGEPDDNGVWQPIAYAGTYGTNGFWLKFSDNSAATATTLGKDYSGNGNNWTPNNLSVTAGAGNDSLVDTPTSYGTDTGAGGEVRGNYCTLNPLQLGANITLSNGNLDGSQPSGTGTNTGVTGTIGLSSGKWYWETTVNTRPSGSYTVVGIASSSWRQSSSLTVSDPAWIYYGAGTKQGNGSETAYGASYGVGDVIGIGFDADNGTLTFYKNGVSQGTAFTGLTSGPYFPIVGKNEGACAWTWSCNFGQRPFAYTAPSGFKALCDTNLPAPVVAQPSTVMDVKLYTGNGSTQTISGLGFSPDLVWIKVRNTTHWHELTDSVRGTGKTLFSNATDSEITTNTLTAFNTNGFTVAVQSGYNGTNESARPYVAWAWDAGSSTVTNTQGSITSSVRANPSAGFSIVTYTSQASGTGTIGHGLGVAPSLIINKPRNQNVGWTVYHASLGNSAYLILNTTAGQVSGSSGAWNSTSPSSTVFTQGTAFQGLGDMVAYCFAPVAGYSAFGSYTGNGSADGPFVYTGFRPRWVMVKDTSNGTNRHWIIIDTARSLNNESASEPVLFADNGSSESPADNNFGQFASKDALDLLSNGFKVRESSTSAFSQVNLSTNTYIYAAFAENPFQYARAR